MRLLISAVCISLLMTTGCAKLKMQTLAPGEAPVVVGPAARANRTPLESAMTCYNGKLAAKRAGNKLQVAVGEIKDYTGKMSDSQGMTITQGGSLMLFSGLYKLKDAVTIHDRFDTRVTDNELKYIGLKQLGDGKSYDVGGQKVPWLPYFGGSIKKSDYTILGGITELNYNIQSGGVEFRISGVGPGVRVYTMNVATDLRLVNTQTLEVVSAISLQKQFTGYEVGFELFRFYNVSGSNELFDVNIGNKSQEPLQLGVRALLEESILRLLADATGVSHTDCMPDVWDYSEKQKAVMSQLLVPTPPMSDGKEQAVEPVKPASVETPAVKPVEEPKVEAAKPASVETPAVKPVEEPKMEAVKPAPVETPAVKPAEEPKVEAVKPAPVEAQVLQPAVEPKAEVVPVPADSATGNLTAEDVRLTPNQEIKQLIEKRKHPATGGIRK